MAWRKIFHFSLIVLQYLTPVRCFQPSFGGLHENTGAFLRFYRFFILLSSQWNSRVELYSIRGLPDLQYVDKVVLRTECSEHHYHSAIPIFLIWRPVSLVWSGSCLLLQDVLKFQCHYPSIRKLTKLSGQATRNILERIKIWAAIFHVTHAMNVVYIRLKENH